MIGFSVLLSVYQKEQPAFLEQSLDSIFSQTLLPSEVVIVKDGPLTRELNSVLDNYVRKYSIVKLVSLKVNQGLGQALNFGLQYCSCELVARMDTDDIAKPDRFEKQIKVFTIHPDIDVCGAWIDEFENSVYNVLSTRKVPELHTDIVSYAKNRNPINHPVVMFRKSMVIAAGGYMHFPLFEDYYLWVRMLLKGAKFYNIQEGLLYFRFSSEMFKRRGGLKYAFGEFKLFWLFYSLGFINFLIFARNVNLRFLARVVPNNLRALIYKRIIRR